MEEMIKGLMEDAVAREGLKDLLPILDQIRTLSDIEYAIFKAVMETLIEKYGTPKEGEKESPKED